MTGACSVCSHPDRPAIDDALISSTPLRDIVRQHADPPLTISSLSRHHRSHVSPALQAVVVERAQAGAVSALDRFEQLWDEAHAILQALKADGNASKSLQAIQTLAQVVERIAKITGELDERPVVAVNLQQSADWLQLRGQILAALDRHPAAKLDVLAALTGGGPRELTS